MMPINVTVGITYRCNSRCKTCFIWAKGKKVKELSLEEYDKVFENFGRNLLYLTVTGGEPFLRQDIVDIVKSAYDHCRPLMITIPTNSLVGFKIVQQVREIVDYCQKSQIIINLSVDDIGDKNDTIRGVKGHYRNMLKVYRGLRKIRRQNLTLGLHTVISRWNVKRLPNIYCQLQKLKPDSYIAEIAENREELLNKSKSISPIYSQYQQAVWYLENKLKKGEYTGFAKITKAFRQEYFRQTLRVLKEKRQVIACYAGFASAQITPDGDVWGCCVKADNYGNLRDVGLNFRKIWNSRSAKINRRAVKSKKCYCPLANASYTNMLMDIPTLAKVIINLIK